MQKYHFNYKIIKFNLKVSKRVFGGFANPSRKKQVRFKDEL